MDISILIVTYNTANIIQACLDSVFKQLGVQYEIIVVDNASADNSVEVLSTFSDRITLIANTNNVGFGKANNQAFKQSTGRYVFMLNPDAVLQSTTALQELIAYMDAAPSIGLAGTRILKTNTTEESKPSYQYPGQKHCDWNFGGLPGEIAWVLGASMIARREVFELVHGFDEDYFLYGEEADLCLRIRQQGYAIGYCSHVAVEHIGGASEKSNSTEARWLKKQNGLHTFYRKHYPLEIAKHLVKRDLKRATFRRAVLGFRKNIFGLTGRSLDQYHRYNAVCKASRLFIDGIQ